MFEQCLGCVLSVINPAFKRIGIKSGSEMLLKVFLLAPLKNNFGRLQRLQEFVYIIVRSFGEKKFTCCDVEKGDAGLLVCKMN